MRIIPALTAILVTAFLYLLVFERERLVAFALNGEDAAAETSPLITEEADDTALTDEGTDAIGVVALRSVAREVDSAVVLRGQTAADRQVDVRAETSAIVISTPLEKGVFVEEGDALCRLDPGTREASLEEAQARLVEAQARVPEAEARLEEALARLEEARINDNAASQLIEGGFASQTRVATTRAAVSAAQAGVESARAGLDSAQAGIRAARAEVVSAETEIGRLTITAPFGGLLESDTAELGSLMQAGSLCATIIRLDPIMLVGYVPETEVDRVEVGAMAGARLVSGRQVQGQVTFLSRSADPTTRTFSVEIEVPNPDYRISDGQTAEILISAEGQMAHVLPQSALTLNSDGKMGVRIVGADNLVEFVPVSILRDTTEGVFVAGLPETADIIVVGQDFVTAGVKVAPSYREASK